MFIERLDQLCRETSITRYQLAQQIGIRNSTIYGWEKGQQPSADKIVKLADFFQVSADYLLGRENDTGIINANANLTPFQSELLSVVGSLKSDLQREVLGFAKALAR